MLAPSQPLSSDWSRKRDLDLRPGLRSFPVGEYVIFYRIDEYNVLILRVIHGPQRYRKIAFNLKVRGKFADESITINSRPFLSGRHYPTALIGGIMKLTPGKLAGLQRVSDKRGVIAAAAMDQRGSLQKSLAKEKGSAVSDAEMEEFKSLVTEVLTTHASAILLDPEWGLPASKRRAKNAGLLLAYEKTGYDKTGPGRLPDLLDHWSARRLKEAGADCVKILLYYTPFDPQDVNDRKHAWVERIGDECRANDIPFFLEFVGYEEGADEKGLDYAKKKPHIVTESMREFSKDRYGVDVLKVEVPVNMKFVEGAKSFAGQKAYSKKEAIDLFHKAASVATKPFIYLSAGVSNAEFSETLELAGETGVKFNGVLCGRATWKEGIPVYAKQGAAAFRKWLETEGVKNINNVNDKLKAATSWFPIYDVEPAMAGA
jgi:tagatose 1,6-diphosphate aldolase